MAQMITNLEIGNIVLKNLFQSLGDDNCGMERCTWEANINHPKISCASATTVKVGFAAKFA